jgi:hypothetical protein
MTGKSNPGKIHLRTIEVMKRFPRGISGGQIRQELEKEGLDPGEQTHLDRRKRDLKKWFLIDKKVATILVNGKSGKVTLYKYGGARSKVLNKNCGQSFPTRSYLHFGSYWPPTGLLPALPRIFPEVP